MPETTAQISTDRLTVTCPQWRGISGLVHGVTTRQALPEAGKEDFFTTIIKARERGAVPFALTVGGDQVHEDRIVSVIEPIEYKQQPAGYHCDNDRQVCQFAATDALLTTLPGVLLAIQTADCLPLFMVDPAAGIVGLAHCGWRGLYKGLAAKLVDEMVTQGGALDTIQAWIGPCIRADQYEVGADLVEKFRRKFRHAPVSPNGSHLDLAAVCRWQLEQEGLAANQILDSGECTRSNPEWYHSWRGDGEAAGRMLSFIGFAEG